MIKDYLPFFNLDRQPFRLSPDPDFFFPARPHRAVLEVLKFAIERGEGFMVVTGFAGTGKTLLLRLLLRELPGNKLPAVIVTPAVSPAGLVRLLLEELGKDVDNTEKDLAVLLKLFQDTLIELASGGKELLVIIDEAQDVPRDTLEQLRLLSNIELDHSKIIQILLLGQTELDQILADPSLGQLTQRIVINEKLCPLSKEETRDYVTFRLAKAGRADLGITDGAVSALFRLTGGIPRMINRIMDRALLMAAADNTETVRKQDIIEAGRTLPSPAAGDSSAGRDIKHAGMPGNMTRYAAVIIPAACAMILLMAWQQGFFMRWTGWNRSASTPVAVYGKQRPDSMEKAHEQAGSADNQAQTRINPAKRVMVVVNRALVRKGPGNGFDFITAVSSGNILAELERQDRWVMVEVWDASGNRVKGWIREDLVRSIPASGTGR